MKPEKMILPPEGLVLVRVIVPRQRVKLPRTLSSVKSRSVAVKRIPSAKAPVPKAMLGRMFVSVGHEAKKAVDQEDKE